ncbi:MAG: RDAC family protein [Coriobacteriales bacterium]|jgi:hypothetical protein
METVMVLDFHEYKKVKDRLLEEGYHEIHMHDVCGGQYFSIEDPDDPTCDAVVKYMAELGAKVNFSETREEFTVSELE